MWSWTSGRGPTREPVHVMAHARCTVGMRTPVSTATSRTTSSWTTAPVTRSTTTDDSSPPRHRLDERSVLRPDPAAARPLAAPYVVLHLWPGGANFDERSWPPERWRSVAAAMNDRGYEVVLTGGPGDVEPTKALVSAWRATGSAPNRGRNHTGETLVWLRYASGVVSVNTGVMHLAAAVGAPVVALNGPTPVLRWGPVGSASRSVVSPMVPDGYLNLGWEHDDRYRDAMAAITVNSVLSAWDDLMAEVAARRGSLELNPRSAVDGRHGQ